MHSNVSIIHFSAYLKISEYLDYILNERMIE